MKRKIAIFFYKLCSTVALAIAFGACLGPAWGAPINWGMLIWVPALMVVGRGVLLFLGGM